MLTSCAPARQPDTDAETNNNCNQYTWQMKKVEGRLPWINVDKVTLDSSGTIVTIGLDTYYNTQVRRINHCSPAWRTWMEQK